MKLASWNVNSLRVRLPHLLDWLAVQAPDVVCLQETKMEDATFPLQELEAVGYHCAWSGQKSYNGVAILSRFPLSDVATGIPAFTDEQKRVIAATCGKGDGAVRVICAYVPNGQAVGTEKYEYKLRWLAAFRLWLGAEIATSPLLAVLGDYNIAPADADVHDPKAWEGQVLFSGPERSAFHSLLELGLKDGFRLFAQPERSFTWWDYRMNAFRRNLGLRIDHILLSQPLASRCRACMIDPGPRSLERPSDHAPVVAELDTPETDRRKAERQGAESSRPPEAKEAWSNQEVFPMRMAPAEPEVRREGYPEMGRGSEGIRSEDRLIRKGASSRG